LASQLPRAQLLEHAPQIQFQLWCRAIEWYAKAANLPDIAGD
jgi:hypothetical protein